MKYKIKVTTEMIFEASSLREAIERKNAADAPINTVSTELLMPVAVRGSQMFQVAEDTNLDDPDIFWVTLANE